MEHSSTLNGTTLTVSIRGDYGFTDNAETQKIITEITDGDCTLCSIDLSGLQSIDSSGLGMFLLLNEAVKNAGKKIELSKPVGQVLKMLQISKFADIITIKT